MIYIFEFSFDNKRYHTLSYHNKASKFKSQKAVVNAGFTCPNIDGTKGVGGCIFCDSGSACFSQDKNLSVTEQLELEAKRIWKKNPDIDLTAYFQANTNTYGSLSRVRILLEEARAFNGVTAISVATRPDCLSDEMINFLSEFSKETQLTVELGLQTVNDNTGRLINRCYDFSEFEKIFIKLKKMKMRVCVHIIDGLPGETKSDMINTALILGKMQPNAVKIHLLHVIRGTRLHDMYVNGEYIPLEFLDYIDIVISQLELLPKEIVIERITGDGDKSTLIAPMWSTDKIRVLGTIDKCMKARNTYQGQLLQNK